MEYSTGKEREEGRRDRYMSYRAYAVGVQRIWALLHKAATVHNNIGEREVDAE